MPINRNQKLRGEGVPGASAPGFLDDVGDGQFPVWDATEEHWSPSGVPDVFADDAAAAAGGVPVGGIYRTGSVIKVRVS